MLIQKTQLILSLIIFATLGCVNSEVEIPVLKLVKMKYNDVNPSSKPEVLMRQFEYTSSASPAELLKFYEDSIYTESCPYNEMADNYMCELAMQGKISSGHIFIPAQSKGSTNVILADYFFYK